MCLILAAFFIREVLGVLIGKAYEVRETLKMSSWVKLSSDPCMNTSSLILRGTLTFVAVGIAPRRCWDVDDVIYSEG